MLNYLLLFFYIAEIIFFLGTIVLVIALVRSIIQDVYCSFSNVAYIFSIVFGVAVIILYIGICVCLILQTFDKIIPLWMKISGAGW